MSYRIKAMVWLTMSDQTGESGIAQPIREALEMVADKQTIRIELLSNDYIERKVNVPSDTPVGS